MLRKLASIALIGVAGAIAVLSGSEVDAQSSPSPASVQHAGARPLPSVKASSAWLNRRSAAQDHSPWSFQRCLLGLSYGAPLKLAAAIGAGMLYESPSGGADVCVFGAAKVGTGGARTSIGVARSVGALGGGVGMSAGIMRTFGAPLGAIANRNYAGASVHFHPLLALGGEVGWYRRIGTDGAGAPSRGFVMWSVGFGY